MLVALVLVNASGLVIVSSAGDSASKVVIILKKLVG